MEGKGICPVELKRPYQKYLTPVYVRSWAASHSSLPFHQKSGLLSIQSLNHIINPGIIIIIRKNLAITLTVTKCKGF